MGEHQEQRRNKFWTNIQKQAIEEVKQRAVLHDWRGKGESSCNSSGKTVWKEISDIEDGASEQLR